MRERRRQLGLALDALHRVPTECQARRQHLDRDAPPQGDLGREIDDRHTAAAQLALDLVLPRRLPADEQPELAHSSLVQEVGRTVPGLARGDGPTAQAEYAVVRQ